MKKLELTKDELEKLYHLPPKDVEKETEFQITYRMGRNSLVLELIKKIDEELTPHIKYWGNGNVSIKGQLNSKGEREGIWEFFYSNGKIHWRTPYVEGIKDGILEYFWENGNILCRIPYKEGKGHGIVEEFDEQGNISRTRHWKNGEIIEETKPELTPYVEYHDNGNVKVKGQKNSKGQKEGIWEFFYDNGNIQCRTPYKEGKPDGIEEIFYENGNINKRIPLKEGNVDGIKESFFKNGNIRMRTPFKEGKRDGIQEVFDEQGNIITTYVWKEGKLIEETKPELTPYIEYHRNGNVYVKGQLNSKGQREGIWKYFYPNGNIHCRTSFKDGKEDGISKYFWPNGNIIKTTLWKEGKLIEETKPELTPHIKYHPNGNVWVKGQKNSKGQREGLWEWFYLNGNISWRTPYKEGWIDGIEEEFDEQGNIITTYVWKEGKLIEETKLEPQPDPQLIDSMAMRYRYDFGFLDEKHKESIRTTMKQLWEEVVGLGFYKPKLK